MPSSTPISAGAPPRCPLTNTFRAPIFTAVFKQLIAASLLLGSAAVFGAAPERSVIQISNASQQPVWDAPWRFDSVRRSTGRETPTMQTVIPEARLNNPAFLPGAMDALLSLGKVVQRAGVPARTVELLALRASQINGCGVCAGASVTATREPR